MNSLSFRCLAGLTQEQFMAIQGKNLNVYKGHIFVDTLLESYQRRFGKLYEHESTLMATAAHTHFITEVLRVLAYEKVDEVRDVIWEG